MFSLQSSLSDRRIKRIILLSSLFLLYLRTDLSTITQTRRLAVEDIPGIKLPQLNRNEAARWKNLTVATFGASRTWGAGLGPNRTLAYPYLLSENVHNFAIRATGPEYPALCLQTMIGDLKPDVIVLEFYLDAARKLDKLAVRLRERFPDTPIIFLRIWGPMQYQYKKRSSGIKVYMEEEGFNSIWDPDFLKAIRFDTEPSDWKYGKKMQAIKAQDKAIELVDGVRWDLEQPDDGRVALSKYAYFFAEDRVHLSKYGHIVVANNLFKIFDQMAIKPGKARALEWQDWDFCESWYETGEVTLDYHKQNLVMNKFSEDKSLQKFIRWNGKYALEARSEGQWIQLHNPTDGDSEVFVRYMSRGPPPSMYPKTEIILGKETKHGEGVIIDPVVYDYNHKVHVNQVRPVGKIGPGHTIMQIRPLEKAEEPFRLTGVIIAPLDKPENVTTSVA